MEAHIKDLQTTQEQLQNGIIHLREGTILSKLINYWRKLLFDLV